MPTFTYVFGISVDDVIQKKETIRSSHFRTAVNDVFMDWQLIFVPRSEKSLNHRNLPAIKLQLLGFSKNYSKRFASITASFEVVTKTVGEKRYIHRDLKFGFSADDVDCEKFPLCRRINGLMRHSFYGEVPELVKIYPGNVFKIMCRFSIEKIYFDQFDKELVEDNYLLVSGVSKLFRKIADDSDDDFISDVILSSSDNVEFKCHRLVLCTNSTVFNAMFSNKNFLESNNFPHRVNVSDIDGETLEEMLRFIYTKNVSAEFGHVVEQVLYSSEKYDLQELKSLCENALKFELNCVNIFRNFEIADSYRLDSLMTCCLKMFKVYFHLFNDDDLGNFYAKFPRLVSTILKPFLDGDKSDVNIVF